MIYFESGRTTQSHYHQNQTILDVAVREIRTFLKYYQFLDAIIRLLLLGFRLGLIKYSCFIEEKSDRSILKSDRLN